MREKVGERSVLGSTLLHTWFSSVLTSLPSGKHSASVFLQEMLLKRHRVSVITELWVLQSGSRGPKSSPCSVSEVPHPQGWQPLGRLVASLYCLLLTLLKNHWAGGYLPMSPLRGFGEL